MPTSFDANIRLVPTKGARQLVRKVIDERLDDQRDTVGIVNDGLMGNRHPMHVLHDARCFSGRHPVVDVIRQNQPKDVRRHRQTGQIHLWLFRRGRCQWTKVKQKFAVKVPNFKGMGFLFEPFPFTFVHAPKVRLVKRTIIVFALVDVVILAFFDFLQCL